MTWLLVCVSAPPASTQSSHVLPSTRTTLNSGSCPSAESRRMTQNSLQADVQSLILQISDFNCPCGGAGEWRRIAHLHMSNPNQQCPPNWRLISTPVRACGRLRSGSGCDSAVFPSNGVSYSRVCGRVIAYQYGSPSGFYPYILNGLGLENAYIEGASITHGPVGSRQHIWSFVEALYETSAGNVGPDHNCPCTDTTFTWTRPLPSFVQDNYFCDTGNKASAFSSTTFYTDDPLWDGAGCGPTSTCCQFNTPPWFCTTLPQATTDDIELRICADQPHSDEDTDVSIVDIYTM